jgi:transposase-like protein
MGVARPVEKTISLYLYGINILDKTRAGLYNTGMNTENHFPKTLVEAIKHFSNLDVAHDFFAKMRWPNGPVCPHCGSTQVTYMPKYRRYSCAKNHDSRQFTVKTGSVMEDSPLGLDKWAIAFWLEVNAKNSISSYEIHRAIGITQKSAWFMLHRVRLAVKNKSFEKIGGNGEIVEADETAIGGLAYNMHKAKREARITGRGSVGKSIVMGLLQRHSKNVPISQVDTHPLPNIQYDTMRNIIHKAVAPGTELHTDAYQAYRTLGPDFIHKFIDHHETYVRDNVHTNGLENFWSLFKRCIKGTHISVDPFHLAAYLDSEAFRFNYRDLKDGERFTLAVNGYHGKRLTYKALIGASEGAPGADKGAESGNLPN